MTDWNAMAAAAHGRPDLVERWKQICAAGAAEESKWIMDLRIIGVKAAHPDDGWVYRKELPYHDLVQLHYPQFNDGLKVGDLIALGHADCYRVRRVIDVKPATWFRPERYMVIK